MQTACYFCPISTKSLQVLTNINKIKKKIFPIAAEFCTEQLDTWTDISRNCSANTPNIAKREVASSPQTQATFYETAHHILENRILNLFMSL
jgi:hypothetical protein